MKKTQNGHGEIPSGKKRYFPFWPDKWMSDTALRSCPAIARAIWIDLLCLMHEGTPYGHLTDTSGKPLSNWKLSCRSTVHLHVFLNCISTLENAGVLSRTEDGVIYCRKMVRDENTRLARTAGGYKSIEHPNTAKPKKGTLQGVPKGTPISYKLKAAVSTVETLSTKAASEEEKKAAAAIVEIPTEPQPKKLPEPPPPPLAPQTSGSLREQQVLATCEPVAHRLGMCITPGLLATILQNLRETPVSILADRIQERGHMAKYVGFLASLATDAREQWLVQNAHSQKQEKKPVQSVQQRWEPDWFENEGERSAWHEKQRQIEIERAGKAWYAR